MSARIDFRALERDFLALQAEWGEGQTDLARCTRSERLLVRMRAALHAIRPIRPTPIDGHGFVVTMTVSDHEQTSAVSEHIECCELHAAIDAPGLVSFKLTQIANSANVVILRRFAEMVAIKGEGRTDTEALNVVRQRLAERKP